MEALFLGGSFTSDGELPDQFGRLLESATGEMCNVASHTFRQATLHEHLSSDESLGLVGRRTWDLLVLQEQSKSPVDRSALALESICRWRQRIPPTTKLLVMMTWRRREDLANSERWSSHLRFFRGVRSTGVSVSPVGIAWEIYRGTHPHCDLMQPGSSHATSIGVGLSAACLVETVLRGGPVWSSSPRQHCSRAEQLAVATAHDVFLEDVDGNA
jgi:hypothetical protein